MSLSFVPSKTNIKVLNFLAQISVSCLVGGGGGGGGGGEKKKKW